VRNVEDGKAGGGGKSLVQTRMVDVAMRDREPQGRRWKLSGFWQAEGRRYSVEERSVREDEPSLRK